MLRHFLLSVVHVIAGLVDRLLGRVDLGLVASLLLYGVAWTLARTEDRANSIAFRMTEEYRRSEQRFRASMQYSAIGKALLDARMLSDGLPHFGHPVS